MSSAEIALLNSSSSIQRTFLPKVLYHMQKEGDKAKLTMHYSV